MDNGWARGEAGSATWRGTRIVVHRCGGTLAPENTLAALEAGARLGARYVEFDAKLSADDHVYLLHDDDLDRTTNGQGPAVTRRWHELAALDAGSWFDATYAGEPLPSLAAIAARCAAHAIAANIEIKPCPGTEARTGARVAEAVLALWRDQAAPLLSSFSVEALAAARDTAPSLPRAILFEALPADWRETADALGCVSVHVDHVTLAAAQVEAIHASGRRVLAYTVNEPARAAELAGWGVDLICTDRPDQVVAPPD